MTVGGFTAPIAGFLGVMTIVVAVCYLFLGLDDLWFDASYWIREIKRARSGRNYKPLTVAQLRDKPQQRIAIFIPCWREAEVVDRMLAFAIRNIDYRNYEILVGVYPNDIETKEKVVQAARKYPHVRAVINETPGPTTKAQNLNSIFSEMEKFEGRNRFDIIVMHDVEDVIHPFSMMLYNYLMPRNEMVQLPVFPLERPWYKWTAWTYADEFAEVHLKDLVQREAMGSFVPSAGVGCGFSRPALDVVQATTHDIFPAGTLTEDYQVALRLNLKGFKTIFVHQRLQTKQSSKSLDTASFYVATRAYFPDTLRTAVLQKSRWVAGICFQAWGMAGWVGNAATRYTLYRDRKGLFANSVAFLGYSVLLAALALFVWHAFNWRVETPSVGHHRIVWALLDFVLIMTAIRLLEKAFFAASIYGVRQGLLALLRPPWAGIINGLATFRAAYLVTRAMLSGTKMTWQKTDHVFPTDQALGEFRRQLGEVLVDTAKITEEQLQTALEMQTRSNLRLGETLIELGFVSERDIVEAMGAQSDKPTAVGDDLVVDPSVLSKIPLDVARERCWLPLRIEDGNLIVAVGSEPTESETGELQDLIEGPFETRLAEATRLEYAIERSYRFGDERRKPLGLFMVEGGYLERETLDLMLDARTDTDKPLLQLCIETGVLTEDDIFDILQEYFGVAVLPIPSECALEPELVARLPRAMIEENELAVLTCGGRYTVAAAFPVSELVLTTISKSIGHPVVAMVARHRDVLRERKRLLDSFPVLEAVS